jgi:hypothetical protein
VNDKVVVRRLAEAELDEARAFLNNSSKAHFKSQPAPFAGRSIIARYAAS